MAWIKLESHTPDKIEIFQMAKILNIDIDSVTGKCCRIWAWFDLNTTDGVTDVTVKLLLDRITCSGFCDAMLQVGWIIEDGDKLCLPNYDRHNSETAKQRGLSAKRMSKMRNFQRNNSVTSVTEKHNAERNIDKIREDKIREDSCSASAPNDNNEINANADEIWTVDVDNPAPMHVHDDLTINTQHSLLLQPLVATIRKYSKRPIVDAVTPALITSCEENLRQVYDLCKKTGNDYGTYMVGQLNYSSNSLKLQQATVIVRALSDIASASIRYLTTLDNKKQAEPDVVPLFKPEEPAKLASAEDRKLIAELIEQNTGGKVRAKR
jgi:hypothetical protein